MHFFKTLLVSACAIALAAADAPMITSIFKSLNAGDSVKITWTGGDPSAPVDLVLRSGDSNNLNVVGAIGSGSGGSFTWVVPSNIQSLGTYAIEIKQGGQSNYSPQFAIMGGSATATPTGSTTSSAVTSTSSLTITTTSTSASTSASTSDSTSISTSSASGNLTSSVTLKTTGSTTKATATGPSSTLLNANTAAGLASPLALVLSAVMAMIYFN
ncbi:MAG: hypothetical protein M1839_005464 [Geoglossum umbratile]|nr:MAG: hypothetical protein M1839_005464 [Geoglossum umbratile]